MTIQNFITKAIEGGWRLKGYAGYYTKTVIMQWAGNRAYEILLDPLAWQAVGKMEGWELEETSDPYRLLNGKSEAINNIHRMIDALAEGKTIEQFIATL